MKISKRITVRLQSDDRFSAPYREHLNSSDEAGSLWVTEIQVVDFEAGWVRVEGFKMKKDDSIGLTFLTWKYVQVDHLPDHIADAIKATGVWS